VTRRAEGPLVPDEVLDALDAQLQQWERERDLSGAVLLTHAGSMVFGGS
jgi:hypothetical protein